MTSVDKYVSECLKMAGEAKEDNAHVAVFTYYRNAIEEIGYNPNAEPYVLLAIHYAQGLKKDRDRKAIADWSLRVLEKIKPGTSLEGTINQIITKLQTSGKENATT